MLHIATFFVVLLLCQQNVDSCPSSPTEEAATKPPETQKTSEIPKPPRTPKPSKTTTPSETQKTPDTVKPSTTLKTSVTTQPLKTSKPSGTEKPVTPSAKKYIMVTTGITNEIPGNYVNPNYHVMFPN